MTTALYRRYRPETFAEVIGQEHVTGPLMQALRSGRVNHAYLFSGPRGCGKTTSARILARTLNCHQNTPETPLDTPCGTCPSCVELARGGSGSLDVVEIDAASHGGVDDARDLRERATFAPARDRYKIFIIDEAHMVSSAGFNALLKIVEEPPPHIKFVFATTEPDKVIGTIRSRTHHYPFRLVPPDVLSPYLESLCQSEGVTLGGGVVPLVVRAGGGSVRDSLSVLDQLIAGASDGVVDYDLAVGLLGYTHSSLLDDVVDALAARDGASLFRVVDQLIASGHAPQRFVDDLLERLRDLIVIAVSGDAAGAVLRGQPADQLERMRAQASRLGVAELSRAADLVNAALTEMTGATSPRLHLELLCARLLLPGADEGTAGLAARVERLERGGFAAPASAGVPVRSMPADDAGEPMAASGGPSGAAVRAGGPSGAAAVRAALQASRRPAAAEQAPARAAGPASADQPAVTVAVPAPVVSEAVPAPVVSEAVPAPVLTEAVPAPAAEPVPPAASTTPVPPRQAAPVEPVEDDEPPVPSDDEPPAPADEASVAPPAPPVTTEVVRRRWEEALSSVPSERARAFLKEHAQVLALDQGVLRLGFAPNVVAAARTGNMTTISDAVYGTLGIAVTIDIVEVDAATGARPRDPAPVRTAPSDAADSDDPLPPAGERPGSSRRQPGGVTNRDTRPGGSPSGSAADDADAAWLAGAAMYEPPAEDEPEPPLDDVEPTYARGAASNGARPAVSRPTVATVRAPMATATSAAPAVSVRPGFPRRETPVEAVQRHALQARTPGAAPSSGTASGTVPSSVAASAASPDPYDDAATDDPEIASTGLVGVPLVVKLLDGTIIDEQVDQT